MNWMRWVGRRNLGYVGFVALLIPAALALEAAGPSGPDAGGGMMFGFILWGLVSAVFFLLNLVLLIRDLMRGTPAAKAFIACALPVVLVVGTLMVEDIAMGLRGRGTDPAVLDDEAAQRG
ncbi:hypothetical protein [Dongia rigui]|uniref:DUF805 domain-containing protein n=1 Tax=Dongia rigui TaxID=940149 RepID=A0ABU5E1V2_9PROT|nr:hypothetical protein [Dongia rigui]MDY0872883.1 hypothetical protein [Dongia rigui]